VGHIDRFECDAFKEVWDIKHVLVVSKLAKVGFISITQGRAANSDQHHKTAGLVQTINDRGQIGKSLLFRFLVQAVIAAQTKQDHARLELQNLIQPLETVSSGITDLSFVNDRDLKAVA